MFTTIHNDKREKLGLTMEEYAVADLIHRMSKERGYATLDNAKISSILKLKSRKVRTILSKLKGRYIDFSRGNSRKKMLVNWKKIAYPSDSIVAKVTKNVTLSDKKRHFAEENGKNKQNESDKNCHLNRQKSSLKVTEIVTHKYKEIKKKLNTDKKEKQKEKSFDSKNLTRSASFVFENACFEKSEQLQKCQFSFFENKQNACSKNQLDFGFNEQKEEKKEKKFREKKKKDFTNKQLSQIRTALGVLWHLSTKKVRSYDILKKMPLEGDYTNITEKQISKSTRGFSLLTEILRALREVDEVGKPKFTKDDFIKVIDYKAIEWPKDHPHHRNLNPHTLFRKSNFERYIEQANEHQASKNKKGQQNSYTPIADQLDKHHEYFLKHFGTFK